MSSAGTLTLSWTGDSDSYAHDVAFVDASGNVLAEKELYSSGTLVNEVASAGSYYVRVEDSHDDDDYAFTVTSSSTTGARETEPNNTIATADTITSGQSIKGQSSSYSDIDYYKVVMSSAGTLSLSWTGDSDIWDHDVAFVDGLGNVLAEKELYSSGTLVNEVASAGSYYVRVEDSHDDDDYTFQVDIT